MEKEQFYNIKTFNELGKPKLKILEETKYLNKLSGIYAIVLDKKEIIYIGKSVDILNRLYNHTTNIFSNRDNVVEKYINIRHLIKKGHEIYYKVIQKCDEEELTNTERYYIGYYKPILNKTNNSTITLDDLSNMKITSKQNKSNLKYDKNENEFFIINNELQEQIIKDCGLAYCTLYHILFFHKKEDIFNSCCVSYSVLMKECNISKPTLINGLKKLEENGYIKIQYGGGNNSNKYFFPKADISITHYTQEELNYINSIERKKPTINTNVSEKSKENLKNYKKVNNISNIETNPFE